ncbi:MAG TPA: arginine--tRNA ligase [Candidatus Elarobacter sp.]|nr:arginine--tRNA ligase [Candidatus Elarobacter sp.]
MSPTTTEESAILSLDELAARFAAAARALWADAEPVVQFEAPRRAEFGDVATNVAFSLARVARKKPQDIATDIIARAMEDDGVRATVEDATPLAGFINLRLRPAFWQRVVAAILRDGTSYGKAPPTGETISLEFGSANPTGPLAVVQGRALSIGDTLANALRHQGYGVFVEWIINDAGNQVRQFGLSVLARYRQLFDPSFPFPEDGYAGEYVIEIARALRDRDGDRWLDAPEDEAVAIAGRFGIDMMVAEQQADARAFRVHYDLWQSEQALHDAGTIRAGIERMRGLGRLYEKDGATWLRTTDSGDDQDRVVIRRDGVPTYLANDIAYHYEKLQRGDRVVDILGPDHHGYIGRLNALADAYGRSGAIEVIIAQHVTLKRGDDEVKMSKRAGAIVTLREVMDEVGVDAARFFFIMLSTDQPLTFDLELAKKQTNDNPVYYVQYGHARIASVLRRARESHAEQLAAAERGAGIDALTDPAELALVRRLAEFAPTVSGAARARAPHRLAKYARDVAAEFHQFYDACRVLGDDAATTTARLALSLATKTILATTLELCGVRAPDTM